MTRGGARKGAGRKVASDENKRHPLNCLVAYQTQTWVKSESQRTGYSAGEIVDLAVETLQQNPDRLPPDMQVEE